MNGELISELRALAKSDDLDPITAIRLLLAAQAETIECYRVTDKKLDEHNHDEKYAKKDHKHPLEYLTAGITALIAAAYAAFKN